MSGPGWRRGGLVVRPGGAQAWAASHAANPFAVATEAGFELYYSPRDAAQRSCVARVAWSCDQGFSSPAEMVLPPGDSLAFDRDGVSMGSLVRDGDDTLMYYLGWERGSGDGPPFRNRIGLAISRGGGPFSRLPEPVLDLGAHDPLGLSYPWVVRTIDGWRMWYGSVSRWHGGFEDQDHVLKRATSQDGRTWSTSGAAVLEAEGDAWALSRPCILHGEQGWDMWFSERGRRYRIRHARSADGETWQRSDLADGLGLDPAPGSAWEDQEVCYPCVIRSEGELVLFYCGNGYGRTGFGWAHRADPSRGLLKKSRGSRASSFGSWQGASTKAMLGSSSRRGNAVQGPKLVAPQGVVAGAGASATLFSLDDGTASPSRKTGELAEFACTCTRGGHNETHGTCSAAP